MQTGVRPPCRWIFSHWSLQEVVDECGSVCAELELRQPVAVNPATQNDIPPLLQAFIQAAVRPEKALAIPQTPSLKASQRADTLTAQCLAQVRHARQKVHYHHRYYYYYYYHRHHLQCVVLSQTHVSLKRGVVKYCTH